MKKAFLNLFTAEGRRHEVPTSILLSDSEILYKVVSVFNVATLFGICGLVIGYYLKFVILLLFPVHPD